MKKLTAKQRKKLPPKLQAAIARSGKRKHMDDDDDDDDNDNGPKNKDKADLNKDGKLSPYEKKRGKAIEDAMKGDKECSCGCDDLKDCTCDKEDEDKEDKKEEWSGTSLPTFSEWLEWRQKQ